MNVFYFRNTFICTAGGSQLNYVADLCCLKDGPNVINTFDRTKFVFPIDYRVDSNLVLKLC